MTAVADRSVRPESTRPDGGATVQLAFQICEEMAASRVIPRVTEVHRLVRERLPGKNPSLTTIQRAVRAWEDKTFQILLESAWRTDAMAPADATLAVEMLNRLFVHAKDVAARHLDQERAELAQQLAQMERTVEESRVALVSAQSARDLALAEMEAARKREAEQVETIAMLRAKVAAAEAAVRQSREELARATDAHSKEVETLRNASASLDSARKAAMLQQDGAITARMRAEESEKRTRDEMRVLQGMVDSLRGRLAQASEEAARQRGRAEAYEQQMNQQRPQG
ncbi:hypothetical protein [Burkholderia sp. MBR-1]|uniref:hypothetical protein n=1 Tax=Burkholderia sp. MBR-1 TaxID=2732364 RepID=UPI0015EEAD3B|nr:hypothetical protein [Burkholderia sp. MBR-1]QMI49693.1 hypothetical protein MBR110_29865 [Burkholderia sp. MBR-1]